VSYRNGKSIKVVLHKPTPKAPEPVVIAVPNKPPEGEPVKEHTVKELLYMLWAKITEDK
jgi:hypothetical protein